MSVYYFFIYFNWSTHSKSACCINCSLELIYHWSSLVQIDKSDGCAEMTGCQTWSLSEYGGCVRIFYLCVCVCVCAYLPLCVDMGVIKLLKPALCLMGDCIVCCRSGFKGIKTLLLTWISSIRPSQYHTSTQRPSGCTHTHAFLFFLFFIMLSSEITQQLILISLTSSRKHH